MNFSPAASDALPMLKMHFESKDEALKRAPKPIAITVPVLNSAPKMDGKIDDDVWKQAASRTLPSNHNNASATTVRYGRYGNTLYFAFQCQFDWTKGLKAVERQKDDKVWNDDSLAILLGQPGVEQPVYRFLLNAKGSILDMKENNTGYNPEWQSVVQQNAGEWTAEVVIPASALELAEFPQELRANIGRTIPEVGQASISQPYDSNDGSVLRFDGIEKKETANAATGSSVANSIELKFDRHSPSAGERWLAGKIIAKSAASATIRATLYDVDSGKELGRAEEKEGGNGSLLVNMRDAGAGQKRLRVEILDGGKTCTVQEILLVQKAEKSLPSGTKIPVRMDIAKEYEPSSAPVTFGVAFPAGEIWSLDGLQLVDGAGKAVPAQLETSATWYPQGSIKWIRVDTDYAKGKQLFVKYVPGKAPSAPSTPIRVTRGEGGNVEVDLGNVKYELSADLSPVRSITQNGRTLATAEGGRGLYVVDQKGRVASISAKDAKVDIEASGPVAACVRIEGAYRTKDGEELARHVTRVEFAAGETRAHVTHSLIASRSTKEVWFKEVGWEMNAKAGSGSQAVFGISPADWKASQAVPVSGNARVYMLQDRHYQYFHGDNHFEIAQVGGSKKILEGKECGDWAALRGGDGGLLMGCRNAAKMHPKEFSVTAGGVSILLFSPRSGEELDFTLKSRVKTIDLDNLVKKTAAVNSPPSEQVVKTFLSFEENNDALGWSKTHEMVIDPIQANAKTPEQFAQSAAQMSYPVYALTDPQWLCDSGALGVLHPYDPQHFPEAEKFVGNYVESMRTMGDRLGEFGFLDYQYGPHFVKDMEAATPELARYFSAYNFREDLWYLYARRGQRTLREFAEGSNRYYLDCFMVHASDGKRKIAGFHAYATGSDGLEGAPVNMPVPWGGMSVPEMESTSDLEKMLLDYYLTGYRRGKDAVVDYGEAAKEFFDSSAKAKVPARGLRFLYNVLQAYSVNWDDQLGWIADEMIHYYYLKDGALGFYVGKYFSTSYKTQSDYKAILFAYYLTHDPRLKEMALKTGEFWQDNYGISMPYNYQDPSGYVGAFLYYETGDKGQAQDMAWRLRQMPAEKPRYNFARESFFVHGFATAEKVAMDSGAWSSPVASYSGVVTLDKPAIWLFQHVSGVADTIRYRWETPDEFPTAGGNVRLWVPHPRGAFGYDTMSTTLTSRNTGIFKIPVDVKDGVFAIQADNPGAHYIMAENKIPLVACMLGYWAPAPQQNPPDPIYFKVPTASKNAELFLEKEGMLTDPEGKPWNNGKPVKGWTKLPGSDKGLWKLTLAESGLINGKGFPQFYAFGSPDIYFLPEMENIPVQENVMAGDSLDIPSSIKVDEKNPLVIPLPASVTGAKALAEGTLEFYFRPATDAAELPQSPASFLQVDNTEGDPITLFYYATGPAPYFYELASRFPIVDMQTGRSTGFRPGRKFFPRKDQWYHIALSWGQSGIDARGRKGFMLRLFVNGEYGSQSINAVPNSESQVVPKDIRISLPGEVASLRLSAKELYTHDFVPPTPRQLIRDSVNNLAVFDFENGSRQAKVK